MTQSPLHLFDAVGIELEYMIVDRDTLAVRPIADTVLRDPGGSIQSEIEHGTIAWSNELVSHVIELKTNGPARFGSHLQQAFQGEVETINLLLAEQNAMLMPSSMHPWMDPLSDTELWPHDYSPVYEAYNRIFDCRGHGWANLQSIHINLPFAGDDEFEKLHAAIRVLLPILPGLAASSPIAEGKDTGFADYRLEVYRHNAQRVPSVAGVVIPEAVFNYADYDAGIFQKMYHDIAPLDTDTILQEEWLNSRGAIARFDRGSIEIRILDIQECPAADMAVARCIIDVLKALCGQRWCSLADQKAWGEEELAAIFLKAVRDGGEATITNPDYLRLFGVSEEERSVGQVWQHLFEKLYDDQAVAADPSLALLGRMLNAGTLSSRIKKALGSSFASHELQDIYRTLSACLQNGTLFAADA